MQKSEIIYRELLDSVFERKTFKFTQLALAKKFKFSLSTVNNGLKPLVDIGAIEKHPRFFTVVNIKKILYYWATIRRFKRDVIYSTYISESVLNLEKHVPNMCTFTCFSAFKFIYKNIPSDYSEVYFYSDEQKLDEIKSRFPQNKKVGIANVIVTKADEIMLSKNQKVVSKAQLFVDLWNLKQWQASEFLNKLEEELKL